ncbi:MAG: hypothetical protein J6J27_00020 [Alphaproteobacteria bacterium]|nr:hypothetical protein [Alphaproteobacteria bacterium]
MYKKLLKLCIVCSLLFVSTGVTASMWDAWTDEDEEFNMMGTAPQIGSWKNSNRKKSNKTNVKKSAYQATYTSSYQDSEGSIGYDSQSFFNVDSLNNQKPIVVCRQKGCTQLNDKMTRNYLFNAIANLLYVNNKTKVYLCEANTSTRACISNGLKYAVNIGGTAGVIYIPSITITDVSFSQNLKRISFMFSYDLYANGLKSFCSSSHNTIEISEDKQALIRDNTYKCQLTSDLPSTSYNIYNIDYLDLDYGIIGAYYSTGMSGASNGGHDGYVLMKFQYTDKNTVRPASTCKTGICDDESYRIAPGQYEIIPLDKNKAK